MEKLPFDLRAVLIGIRRRLAWIIGWFAISLAIGIAAAFLLGKKSWDSYCVLLYQPPTVELSGRVYEPPVVQTQLNLVKLRPNLEETRAILQLPVSLRSLGGACDITNPRDTQMLIVKCEWDDPTQSATIANTLANVFIASQTRVRNDQLSDAVQYLVNRRQMLNQKIQDYVSQESVPIKDEDELLRQITRYQSRMDSMDDIYDRAASNQKATKMKIDHLATQIDEVRSEIANEEEESVAMVGLSNLSTRIERVRESIADQRRFLINEVVLKQAAQKLAQVKSLYENNAVSKLEYESAQAEHQMALAQATDTEEVKAWKQELDSLYSKMRPSNKKNAASGPILRDLLMREFNLNLEFKGIQEVLANTEKSRLTMGKELEQLLEMRRSATSNGWQVEAWRDELGEIDKSEAIVSSLINTEKSDFEVVSSAAVSPFPTSSSRRLLATGVSGFLFMLGSSVIVALELLQSRVRTAHEVKLVIDQPVIGVLTKENKNDPADLNRAANVEQLRSVTNAILQSTTGPCNLVSGCHSDDGSSSVTWQIAKCLARQNRKVAIVQGHCRTAASDASPAEPPNVHQAGLSELFSAPDMNPRHLLTATDQPFVSVLSHGTTAFHPELLGSSRMGEIVSLLKVEFEIVLVDGPPLCDFSDAEFLANHVDSTLLVVDGSACTRSDLKKASDRIQKIGTPLIGAVMNRADPTWVGMAASL